MTIRDHLRTLWKSLDPEQRNLVKMFGLGAVVVTVAKIVTADRWWR